MSKLFILYDFNPYFNRTIQKFDTYNEYPTWCINNNHLYTELLATNFDVTDGVNAKHIINVATKPSIIDKSPSYCVLENANGELSRWFVLECLKIRGGQYQLSLKRDVIADYWDIIKESPCFIQKGMLPYDSPLIFNSEGMTFNEIKTKEILLKDKTKSSWLVGYLARKYEGSTEPVTITGKSPSVPSSIIDFDDLPTVIKNKVNQTIAVPTMSDMYADFTIGYKNIDSVSTRYLVKTTFSALLKNDKLESVYELKSESSITDDTQICYLYSKSQDESIAINTLKEHIVSGVLINNFMNDNNITSQDRITVAQFNQFKNRTISKDGKNYKLTFSFQEGQDIYCRSQISERNMLTTTLGIYLNTLRTVILNSSENFEKVSPETGVTIVDVKAYIPTYRITLEEIELGDVTTTFTNARNPLYDSPYDMFAIPMGENMKISLGESETNVAGNVALPIARAISLELGSNVYDCQIIPYCPFVEALNEIDNEIIELNNLVEHKDYELIKNASNENISVVLFPTTSSGTFDIEVDVPELKQKEDNIERKVASETIKARLVSPNYASSFEFNPQKNNGVEIINVDYNLKPISPYIHVAPVFDGLYGGDYNDARGLICSGDFSISLVNSQWNEYQIANKNYENIFNRQIDNMDVNNSIAMEKAKLTATLGGITNAIAGGIGGTIATGNIGAGIGTAAISGASSVIGGIMDIGYLARQQSENRSYATDMYNYNLGNIKALPYTLSKVTAFNENNKVFPFIEIYDCTEIEKQNLRDKIKYNGMTVMVQGKIKDYISSVGKSYIQAQLIRLEGIDEDSHLINEIYNELMKGVYVNG